MRDYIKRLRTSSDCKLLNILHALAKILAYEAIFFFVNVV